MSGSKRGDFACATSRPGVLFISIAAALAGSPVRAADPPAADAARAPLLDALKVIRAHRFVDLTHTFGPSTPHWKGFGDEKVDVLYTIKKTASRCSNSRTSASGARISMRPRIFHEGLRTVDQVPVEEMMMPLVVLDVHAQVAKNADYTPDARRCEGLGGAARPHSAARLRGDAHRLGQALAQ